ncbi:Retrovirus-related Pol polyprotein from transposon TNT 1-94, partial [Durusdinium trenchii]
MHKSSIRFAEVGEPSLLIFSIPSEISRSGENGQAYAQPLLSREGGVLVDLLVESLSLEALSAAQQADDQDLLGPSYVVTVGLCEEDEFGQIYSIDHEVQVLLVDLSDSALQAFREYDPVTDSLEELQAYDDHHPAALPLSASLVSLAKQWTEDLGQSRLNFYSAREELETQSVAPKTPGQPKKAAPKRLTNAALAEQVAALATQVQALTALQQMPRPRPETAAPSAAPAGGQRLGLGLGPYPQMPALGQGFAHLGRPKDAAVKAAASLLGPPPKTQKKPAVPALPEEVARDEPQDPFQQAADPMLAALSLQSTALTSLVAHLAGHSTDPLIDLQGGSISSSSSSTRGVARREKMQSDLALRQSNYWLAFLQQLSRRMNPSRPLSQALTSIGPSCNPYDKVFNGFEVAPTTDAEELKPYRNLDAKRLVLTGRGAWDATEFLQDEPVLAFREPASLLFTDEPLQEDVPLITDDPSEIVALASVWDKQGLLFIHDGRAFDEHPECYTRIFNAFKNVKMDRQIGDRRSRNSCEGRVKGPSAFLPCGPDLLDWYCNPRTHYIAQAITDRKDFYHQFAVSDSRAFSNTVGPPVDASELEQFDAFSAYLLRQAKSRYHRGLHGDRLGLKGQHLAKGQPQKLFGQYTKSSAMYTEDLARNLALVLHDAILAKRALDEDWDGAPSAGLESLLVNQLALEAPWQTEKKWTFKGASHINIQESVSVLRAIEHASRKGSPQRTSILVDSNVVRCAVSKGRTSSRGLMPILAKINAVSLAAGQYLCLPFCPTRLNPSDDPTRGVELRSPVREGATLRLSLSEWEDMASHKGLRSTAANWLRFVVLVGGTHLLSLRDQSSFRQPPVWEYRSFLNRAFPREFDSTLGFPVTIEPRNPGDQRRADYRKRIGPLPTGRPVLKVTEKRREVLLSAFTRWLEGRGVVVDDLF